METKVTRVGGASVAPVSDTTALTVSGQSVLVRLGTDNLVYKNAESPTYSKIYAAVVTDTAGNPIAGTEVHFALRPGQYSKGSYHTDTFIDNGVTTTGWFQTVNVTCPNEDRNFDGNDDDAPHTASSVDVENQTDPGAGLPNGYGSLQPGMPATVNTTGTTDASGVANATITYPPNHATWTEVILEARTGVTSNDPPAYTTFFLPCLALDYLTINVDPPGKYSPWGSANASCGDLN